MALERCSELSLQDRNILFLIVHRNDDRNCGRIRRMGHNTAYSFRIRIALKLSFSLNAVAASL